MPELVSLSHDIHAQPALPAEYQQVKRVEGFDTIRAEYPGYLSDESKLASRSAELLFFPKDEAELAAVIRGMSERQMPMTIAGARTGLVGGSVPARGAVVSMERFDQVESIYYDEPSAEWRVIAQTSVSLKSLGVMLSAKSFPTLERALDPGLKAQYEHFKADKAAYFYPPDPTETSATLGGSVVTNASGARTYRFGPTRTWVRAMRVFLANGEYLDIPRGCYFADQQGQFVVHTTSGEVINIDHPGLYPAEDQVHSRLFHRAGHGPDRPFHRVGGGAGGGHAGRSCPDAGRSQALHGAVRAFGRASGPFDRSPAC